MTRAILSKHQPEEVTLLTEVVQQAGRFGEGKTTWRAAGTVLANVQPLGIELVTRYGLNSQQEYHRAYLPVAALQTPKRVLYRGKEYVVVKAERWQSYTMIVMERVSVTPKVGA